MIGFWAFKFLTKFTCMWQRFFEFQKEMTNISTLDPATARAAYVRPCQLISAHASICQPMPPRNDSTVQSNPAWAGMDGMYRRVAMVAWL